MASSDFECVINKPFNFISSSLSNPNFWAVLIPNYLDHEFNDDKMIWVFKGDFGIIQKAIKVSVSFDKTNSNEKIRFFIRGLSDSIDGVGSFEIIQNNEDSCTLKLNLELLAHGFLSSMMNPILDDFVPTLVSNFGKNISNKLDN